uniref:Uncharacterized protein n=1 Tax=Ciona intestinalis TaxID=7719 RepID=H2XXW0_CIOIN
GSGSATVILDDEFVCCVQPVTGGLGTGVVIIIILIVALLVVGVPLAVYCYKKKKSAKDQNAKDEKELEAGEGEKMAAADELRVQYEPHDDFRLNNSKPMRTFSQK